MPFINGRYHMNPSYGAALERARSEIANGSERIPACSDEALELSDDVYRNGASQGSDSQQIQIDSAGQRHVPQHWTPGRPPRPQHGPSTPAEAANSIYNETSGLRPTTKRGPGSADDLSNARAYVAPIVKAGKVPVASDKLSRSAIHSVRSYPSARAAYQDSLNAANAAFSGHDPTGGATHFYLSYPSQKPPAWVAGKKPVAIFGPFKNVSGGGDVPKDAIVHIVIIR